MKPPEYWKEMKEIYEMGLDQYLTGRKYFGRYGAKPRMEDGHIVEQVELALGYWRKHPNLHGFIVQTFAEGRDECQDIELSADDIHTIITAIQEKALPETTGFFFGESDGSETEEDLEIFGKALGWLTFTDAKENGESSLGQPMRSIVYRASW
jgi:hypothetical protein